MSEECGRILTEPTQHIAPPDRDKDGFYDTTVDCQWSIMLGDDNVIVFEVLEMDIQDAAKCSADSVTVRATIHLNVNQSGSSGRAAI